MRVAILVTDNGPHPPATWANATAGQLVDIIQVAENSPVFEAAEAAKKALCAAIEKALVSHHAALQAHERGKIAEHGGARLMHKLSGTLDHPEDPAGLLDATVATVQACAQGTMFAAHYRKPPVAAFIRKAVGRHFATAMHIERSWHADRNPDDPHAQEFRAQHHAGPGA